MPNYTVRIQHGRPLIRRIPVYAKDRDTAIALIMAAEGCPLSAVLSCNATEGHKWLNPRRTPLSRRIEGLDVEGVQ